MCHAGQRVDFEPQFDGFDGDEDVTVTTRGVRGRPIRRL
jgi:hypothetical protein